MQPHLQTPRSIDSVQAFLTGIFLRRYVTYCARQRRYSQIQAAANLHDGIAQTQLALDAHRHVPNRPRRFAF